MEDVPGSMGAAEPVARLPSSFSAMLQRSFPWLQRPTQDRAPSFILPLLYATCGCGSKSGSMHPRETKTCWREHDAGHFPCCCGGGVPPSGRKLQVRTCCLHAVPESNPLHWPHVFPEPVARGIACNRRGLDLPPPAKGNRNTEENSGTTKRRCWKNG